MGQGYGILDRSRASPPLGEGLLCLPSLAHGGARLPDPMDIRFLPLA